MLVFITSIRHPQNSNRFDQVERLLGRTLRSVCAQTDRRFRVVVVANRPLHVDVADDRISYHYVPFPPPVDERRAATGIDTVMRDKGTKLLSGVLFARRFDPSYFAFFDADDFVSRRIAGFVNARPDRSGWYVDAGYVLNHRTGRLQRKSGLVRYCGTLLIANAGEILRRAGPGLDESSSQEQMRAVLARPFLHYAMGDPCPHMLRFLADAGAKMRPLPFRSAIWVQGTGENHTAGDGGSSGVALTPGLCREFGIADPPPFQGAVTLGDRARELRLAIVSQAGSFRDRLRGYPPVPA